MAITDQDIRLMASEYLLDTSDGGGMMTGSEVVDGVSNNLFPDISELDRTIGRVNLRKAFPAVLSDNTDQYYGVNLIVDQRPVDPNVDVCLFSTANWVDERAAAVGRMESYLARGPRYDGYLWDAHIAGQRAVVLLQRPDRALPSPGQTLVITKNPGLVTEQNQFVRISSVSSQTREFSAAGCTGDFERSVVTCEISDALLFDVQGGTPHCNDDTGVGDAHRVYSTVVADASRYAGMLPLAEAASIGDRTIKASGIFAQLVPSAQVETALADAKPNAASATPLAAGNTVQIVVATAWDSSHSLYTGGGVFPGSLSVSVGGLVVEDNGTGILEVSGEQVGVIDYANGILRILSGGPAFSGTKTASFIPACYPARNMQTAAWDVSAESRSGTLVFILDPIPAPSSLSISYMAQGQWYVLTDDGSGALRGADTAYGSGSINFVTGNVVITMGALPDVGSSVIATWGTNLVENERVGHEISAKQLFIINMTENETISPGSVTISWDDKSATDNGFGVLTGDATGTVNYASKQIEFIPNVLPSGGAEISVAVSNGDKSTEIASTGADSLTLTYAPEPGTVLLSIPTQVGNLMIYDDGQGHLKSREIAAPLGGAKIDAPNSIVGTIDYVSKICQVTEIITTDSPAYSNTFGVLGKSTAPIVSGLAVKRYANYPLILDFSTATAEYQSGGALSSLPVQLFNWTPLIDLTPGYSETITAGSVRATLGSKQLVDRGSGRLEFDIDTATGGGTLAGTLSYATGTFDLTSYLPGDTNTGTVEAMLTTLGDFAVNEVVFRAASAPLRPGSLVIQFQYADSGVLETVTANTDGGINATDVHGTVDYETGVVRVGFGRWVAVTPDVEAQPWYFPDAVVEGQAFQPRMALADTLRYAAVAYTYIPLDKNVLGVDPVRLPSDGRVPIYRAGDVVVLHNTQEITDIAPSNGLEIDCGRVRLSRIWVFDDGDSGTRVATEKYSANLDAGTVTLLDISGLVGPLRVEHRVEDMSLVAEVQINGQLTLSAPVTHEFPALTTGVSSALVIGDLGARATRPFDQKTWTGEWSDDLIGDPTNGAEFNDTLYPITVSNAGAIQENWALIFSNTTEVKIVGKNSGQIALLSITEEIAPINPTTNRPYFTINPLGWGGGWGVGNVLRFNTVAANYPVWVARTIQQGPATGNADGFRLQIRGDADA